MRFFWVLLLIRRSDGRVLCNCLLLLAYQSDALEASHAWGGGWGVGWGTWLVVTMRERERLFNWSLRFLNEGLSLQDSVKLTSRYLHLYCKELKNKNIKLRSANRTQQAGATEQRLQLEGYGSIAHCLSPHKSENTYQRCIIHILYVFIYIT